jgi:hypothetical protein
MPTLLDVIQCDFGIPRKSIKTKIRHKNDTNTEISCQGLFICRLMEAYLTDPRNSTKKFIEIINSFGKVAEHKIHIQKSVPSCIPTTNRLRWKSWKQHIYKSLNKIK